MNSRFPIVHDTRARFACCWLGLAAALSGCNKSTPEPSTAPTVEAKPAVTPVASTPKVAPAAPDDMGISWAEPEGWKRGPERPMRKATYEIPPAAGDSGPAELAVFYFGAGQGGDIEANISRWIEQFTDTVGTPERSERTANDLRQYVVEIAEGTYTNRMAMHGPSGPQPKSALVGAVVDAPTGKYFFKLTGPMATVKGAREPFFKLLDSVKATK